MSALLCRALGPALVPKLLLYARIDDRRTWWWRYPEVLEHLKSLSIDVAAVVPIHRVRGWGHPLKELINLPGDVELWLWIGGARDEVIDKKIAGFGCLEKLLQVVKQSGFDGVIGVDYTVFVDACTKNDVLRVVDAGKRLLEAAKGVGIDVVPQVKLCRPSDVVLYRTLGTDIVAYNAIHDLRDGFEKRVLGALSMLKNVGYRVWVAISGYDREYAFLRELARQGVEIDGVLTGIKCEHSKWIKAKYAKCVLEVIEKSVEAMGFARATE